MHEGAFPLTWAPSRPQSSLTSHTDPASLYHCLRSYQSHGFMSRQSHARASCRTCPAPKSLYQGEAVLKVPTSSSLRRRCLQALPLYDLTIAHRHTGPGQTVFLRNVTSVLSGHLARRPTTCHVASSNARNAAVVSSQILLLDIHHAPPMSFSQSGTCLCLMNSLRLLHCHYQYCGLSTWGAGL